MNLSGIVLAKAGVVAYLTDINEVYEPISQGFLWVTTAFNVSQFWATFLIVTPICAEADQSSGRLLSRLDFGFRIPMRSCFQSLAYPGLRTV